MLDPCQRAFGFHQPHERVAFQTRELLLGHGEDGVRGAAGENSGEFAADHAIVIGGEAALVEALHRHGEAEPPGGARQFDLHRLRRDIVLGEAQGERLGIGEQPVAIHGDAVVRPQEQELLGVRR